MIDTMKKGKAGEYQIISTLLSDGYDVLVPVVDNGYDLFATGGKLHKTGVYIQVKTGYVMEKTKSGKEEPFKPKNFREAPLSYNGKTYIQKTWHREFPIRQFRLEQYIDAGEKARVIFQLFHWKEEQDDKKIYRLTLNGNDLKRLLDDGYFFKTVLDKAPDFEGRTGEAYFTDYACLNIGLYQEVDNKDEESGTILVIAKGSNSSFCINNEADGETTTKLRIRGKELTQPTYFRIKADAEKNGKQFCADLIVVDKRNVGNGAFVMTGASTTAEKAQEEETLPFGQIIHPSEANPAS